MHVYSIFWNLSRYPVTSHRPSEAWCSASIERHVSTLLSWVLQAQGGIVGMNAGDEQTQP